MARPQDLSRVKSDPPTVGGHPASCRELFFACSWLALQGFGGVMGVVHRELVDRKRWMTDREFAEEWAVAQALPGPNVINLMLLLGARSFGVRGAIAAVAGLLAAPLVVVVTLGAVASRYTELAAVQGAIRGVGIVAAGLITATALRLAGAVRVDVLGRSSAWTSGGVVFVLVALARVPLAAALLVVGPAICTWSYLRLRERPSEDENE